MKTKSNEDSLLKAKNIHKSYFSNLKHTRGFQESSSLLHVLRRRISYKCGSLELRRRSVQHRFYTFAASRGSDMKVNSSTCRVHIQVPPSPRAKLFAEAT